MTQIAISKDLGSLKTLPVFNEVAKRMDQVRQRAFDMFTERGGEFGHEMEDWLAAEHDVLGWPAAELKERNGTFEMEISLPGFAPKEVEVTATPSEVIVHAATAERTTGEDEKVVWTEFGANDVYRRFAFPDGIDADKTMAELDNGLLRVKAPKSKAAPSEARKILVTPA